VSFEQRRIGSGHVVALAVGLSLLAVEGEAAAFTAPRTGKQGRELAAGGTTRQHRDIAWRAPASAGRAFAGLRAALGVHETMWDRDTGVPLRMWGDGVAAPGSVASAEVAARTARDLLLPHLAALAPGSRAEDLVLVGNDLSAGIRSVGFAQQHRGRPVIGGQLSARFKHDRLIMIASEAFPDVRVALSDAPIADAVARARARAWILADAAASASADLVEGPFILPIVRPGQPIVYREVLRVTVAAEQPIGRFAVYLDAASGEPVAREQLLHFASGTLQFHVPRRGPTGPYLDLPAPRLNVFVNGAAATTDNLGALSFDGGPAAVVAGVAGGLVTVLNEQGASAVKDLALPAGGVALWADPNTEVVDAQLSAYLHANVVKERVRTVGPDFAYLNKNLQVTVNISDVCNAFSDGDSINFFLSGAGCENTARLADVVYHEYGHSVHIQGLINGVGQFDGSLSEGISDFLSATITNDAGVGRGFFTGSPADALRDLDPQGSEWSWPDDLTGQVHDEGRIIGGTLWDLRKALVAKLGAQAGVRRTDHIWFQSIHRAVDIPTMYPEALVADDDDGNLANGTPNECEINVAFANHGLLGASSASGSVVVAPTTQSGTPVALQLNSGSKACVDLAPLGAELRVRPAGTQNATSFPMNLAPGGFTGVIPAAPDGALLEYQVVVTFTDNSSTSFPNNPADPWYQLYHGPTTPLFCSSFEGPPEAEGWQLGAQWQQGAPTGQGGDPSAAFSGGGVVGLNLNGTYSPDSSTALLSPVINTQGFATVRLQYRRWLGVEDGFFDQATIANNGAIVWSNFNSNAGDQSNTQHRDGEWRFHDVDLSASVANGSVQLEFRLRSDGGLEFAGWNLDELCVVGTDAVPGGVCGDGLVGPSEACDAGAGNSDTTPDACRSNCTLPRCGDLVRDSGEQCDDGNLAAGDGCDPACALEGPVATTDVPTTSAGEDSNASLSASDSDSDSESPDSAGLDSDLSDRGCACDAGAPDLPALGLGLLALLGLRRRRR